MRRLMLFLLLLGVPVWDTPPASAQPARNTRGLADLAVGAVAVQVDGADASRVDLSCTNGANNIRVAGSDVTVARGQRIGPGATFSTASTDAIFAIAEGAASTLVCTKESR